MGGMCGARVPEVRSHGRKKEAPFSADCVAPWGCATPSGPGGSHRTHESEHQMGLEGRSAGARALWPGSWATK